MKEILTIERLKTKIKLPSGSYEAVRDVSFSLKKGKTLVILGESGSGKSVMLRSILGLTNEKVSSTGKILYNKQNLLDLSEAEMAKLRGNKLAMIFQNSLSALDPVFKVGSQLDEVLLQHTSRKKSDRRNKVIELFKSVGIPSPTERVNTFPHELSGGMRQRSVIAMALACHPDILLADEPTTALDVTIQAQILNLFKKIQQEHGTSIILVTHDIGVAAEMADEIGVMYAGKIVEFGKAEEVLFAPKHPYTKGLIAATPVKGMKTRLVSIPGEPPTLTNMPTGCGFAPRCEFATETCHQEMPVNTIQGSSLVSCHLLEELTHTYQQSKVL